MIALNIITLILLLIGGLNWGLIGLFNFNLVEKICGGFNWLSRVIYILVLISTIFLIVSASVYAGILLS